MPPNPTTVPVYLDHAATTPMRSEAVAAFVSVNQAQWGNPSGMHRRARAARTVLDDARERFAGVVAASPHEIVFTGSGTEAINTAIRSAIARTGGGRGGVLWSEIEHDAVRATVAALEREGRLAPSAPLVVDASGRVVVDDLDERLAEERPALVAVMAVNNEVGTIEPIQEIAGALERCHRACGHRPLLLVDAVQALTWLDVRPIVAAADYVSFSAHKFGGPKGVGALVVRNGAPFEALIHGGGQEQDRRSGTQNVAGIAAMAVAAECTSTERPHEITRISGLRDRLVDRLVEAIDGCTETVPRAHKVAGNAHVCVDGISSEELLVLLDRAGVCASAGSACASGALHLSPVLGAMGVPLARQRGALRLTLGPLTAADDVEVAADAIVSAVATLRRGS